MKLHGRRSALGLLATGCAAIVSIVSPATGLAVGPDGANHLSQATAYGPITSGTIDSGYNGYSGDTDYYSIRDYVNNGNLVINIQDKYTGDDDCVFWTSCDLVVSVYDSNANAIDPTPLCTEPSPGATQLLPVTLPTPGLYYIAIWTSDGNITCGLGPSQDGQTIPYAFSVQPSHGVGVAPPTRTRRPCTVPAVKSGASLADVKRRITSNHCSVGRVRRVYSRSIRRDHLVALTVRAYTQLRYGSPVGLVLSAGPKPKHA